MNILRKFWSRTRRLLSWKRKVRVRRLLLRISVSSEKRWKLFTTWFSVTALPFIKGHLVRLWHSTVSYIKKHLVRLWRLSVSFAKKKAPTVNGFLHLLIKLGIFAGIVYVIGSVVPTEGTASLKNFLWTGLGIFGLVFFILLAVHLKKRWGQTDFGWTKKIRPKSFSSVLKMAAALFIVWFAWYPMTLAGSWILRNRPTEERIAARAKERQEMAAVEGRRNAFPCTYELVDAGKKYVHEARFVGVRSVEIRNPRDREIALMSWNENGEGEWSQTKPADGGTMTVLESGRIGTLSFWKFSGRSVVNREQDKNREGFLRLSCPSSGVPQENI